ITGNTSAPGAAVYFYLITNPGPAQTITVLGCSVSETGGINLALNQVSFSADIPNIVAGTSYQIEAVGVNNASMAGPFTLTTASNSFTMSPIVFQGTAGRAFISGTLDGSQFPRGGATRPTRAPGATGAPGAPGAPAPTGARRAPPAP